mgnify:CR=1 FL=1
MKNKTIPVKPDKFMLIITGGETSEKIPYDTEQEALDAIERIKNFYLERRERITKTFEIVELLPKKVFRLACAWQMYGTLEIEGDSLEDAIKKAHGSNVGLPQGEYLDDSFEVDLDASEEIGGE